MFKVKNNNLFYEDNYLGNISYYLPSDLLKTAFVIWLLRNEHIDELSLEEVQETLSTILSSKLLQQIIPKEEVFQHYVDGFVLDDEKPSINPSDFLQMFDAKIEKQQQSTNTSNNLETELGEMYPLQQIYYGAPGTGKSHEIKRLTKGEAVVRTTFHPDSDYSTFVGAYKPTMVVEVARVVPVVLGGDGTRFNKNEGTYTEKRIVYRFVMQAFLKAYLGAWKKYSDADGDHIKPQFLIIEEINRGNCAQIFGDLFQLLDRSDNGFSEYPIEADTDLQKEIARAFEDDDSPFKLTNDINVEGVVENYTSNRDGGTLSKDIQEGYILLLPKNLYIWATMNTSDQSLFPIDSAFKRRWDWKYMPIDTRKETWYIKVGDKHYSWSEFLEKVNGVLLTDETAEDKHLGFYFCKATEIRDGTEKAPNVITMETFVGKVLFYLWNDVFKVYGIHSQIGSSKEWGYAKFYNTDGTVNIQKVNDLMGKLGIAPEGTDASTDEVDAEP